MRMFVSAIDLRRTFSYAFEWFLPKTRKRLRQSLVKRRSHVNSCQQLTPEIISGGLKTFNFAASNFQENNSWETIRAYFITKLESFDSWAINNLSL